MTKHNHFIMPDKRKQRTHYYGKQQTSHSLSAERLPRQVSDNFSKYGAFSSSDKNNKYVFTKTKESHCCIVL